MINKIKKLLKKEDDFVNPFSKINVTDRRIEKFMYCKVCNSYFGDEYENVEVYTDKSNIIKVICNCGEIYHFINFRENVNVLQGDDNIV